MLQAVAVALDCLCSKVTAGSELLCGGLLAASLDGQQLAAAITAHLARPAIPGAEELHGGLCVAAGLCFARAELMLHGSPEALRAKAVTVQSAVWRFREFWSVMLDGVPAGCPLPVAALSDMPLEAPRLLQASRPAIVPRRAALAAEDCQC